MNNNPIKIFTSSVYYENLKGYTRLKNVFIDDNDFIPLIRIRRMKNKIYKVEILIYLKFEYSSDLYIKYTEYYSNINYYVISDLIDVYMIKLSKDILINLIGIINIKTMIMTLRQYFNNYRIFDEINKL